MTTEEKLDRLTSIVDALASSVVPRENQIEVLIQLAGKHQESIEDLERQWQAYIRTLPRQ